MAALDRFQTATTPRSTVPGTDRGGPRRRLRAHAGESGVPVGQCGSRVGAGAERGRPVLGQRARLADVLAGDPERVAVDRRGAVVAPARSRGARRLAERLVPAEPVLRPGPRLR